MRKYRFSTQVLMNFIFIIFVAVMLSSCGSGGGGGSSSSGDTAEKSGIQGTWGNGTSSVTFMSDNTYTVDTNQSGTADAWGTYSTVGNQLTMQDIGGTSSCFDTSSQTFDTGRYTYSIKGNTLTLTLISDNCSGRVSTLTDGNWNGQSSSDKTAPTVPANLSAIAATTSQINLNWSASTDNIGVAGYKIFRNGTLITTTLNTLFSDTGLTSNTPYTYNVYAYDAAGNTSGQSAPASATTLSGATTTYNFSGTVSGAVASGVKITVTGTDSATTTTDAGGNYYFTDADNGTYTITPSKTGYTFSPTSRTITVNNADITGLNFTATANTTPTVMYLTGNWNYAGNIVASDENIESHIGTCSASQTNATASFSCNGTWHSSKTGNSGTDDFGFDLTVTSSNVTIITQDVPCNDGTGSCTCTASGDGSGSEQALILNYIVTSKNCSNPFTATMRMTLTK